MYKHARNNHSPNPLEEEKSIGRKWIPGSLIQHDNPTFAPINDIFLKLLLMKFEISISIECS